jgi:hypothetical protein
MEEEESMLLGGQPVDMDDIFDRHAKVIKYSFLVTLLVSVGFLVGALKADQYCSMNVTDLKLPKPDSEDLFADGGISATFHLKGIDIIDPASSVPERVAFAAGESRLDDDFFGRFDDYIVGMDYTASAGKSVEALLYISLALNAFAAIFFIVYREFPTTLSFKSGSRISTSWKGAIPVWLMLAACMTAIMAIMLANSSVSSVATRFAFYSIRTYSDAASLVDLETALDRSQPRTYLMDTLRIIGQWLGVKGGVKWAVSQYLILVPVIINLAVYVGVFFLDTRILRSRLGADNYSINSDLKRLPRHCRVLPVWASIGLFVLANLATKFAGRSANNWGKALNRMTWTARIPPPSDLIVKDVFSDLTHFFWIEPALLVDGSFLVWVPQVVALFIGSLHRIGLFSKFLELLSYAYLLRTFSIVATILPTSMTILQLPICYEDAQMSPSAMLTTTDFCNDMLYSGHSAGAVTCVAALVYMLVYGPYRQKTISVSIICAMALTSLAVILVARYHFSADILVAIIVCVLVAFIHAPAFKLFFHYKRFEIAAGSYKGVGRVVGQLERVAIDVETLTKKHKIDIDKSDWTLMERRLETVRQNLQNLNSRAN